jgi:hypothetical protein
VAFLPSSDGKTPASSGLHASLNSGTNTVKITTSGGAWGPDLDRLMVPLS